MLLAIDIGNTNITLGVFRFDADGPARLPIKTWRLETDTAGAVEDYGARIAGLFESSFLELSKLRGVAVASVVPALDPIVAAAVSRYLGRDAFFLTGENAGIPILYRRPEEVGADRLANAAAAHEFFGGPVVVLDFGTATTFDCVSAAGEYLGGVIVPGPHLAADALAERTARLPRVEIARPERVIGTTTAESIASGLFYGYVGMITEIVRRTAAEMSGSPLVVATGGLAGLIVPEIREVREIVPELTLEGIRIVWRRVFPDFSVNSVDNPVDK